MPRLVAVPVELFQDLFDAHFVSWPAKLVHGMDNLQGFAEFPSTHTQRDQHLKHAVIRLSALLPEVSHHIKCCFSLVQARIALHSKAADSNSTRRWYCALNKHLLVPDSTP